MNQPNAKNQTHLHQLLLTIQKCLPPDFSYKTPSPHTRTLWKKVLGCGVKSISGNPNANLQALAFVFLLIGCKNDILKNEFMNEITFTSESFTELQNFNYCIDGFNASELGRLTCKVVEYLSGDNDANKTFELLNELFISVELTTLFFRALLLRLKLGDAENCSVELNTHEVYTILTEYFDVKCIRVSPYYFFEQGGLFILPHSNEFVFGRYYETPSKLYESEEVIRKSTLEFIKNNQTSSLLSLGNSCQSINFRPLPLYRRSYNGHEPTQKATTETGSFLHIKKQTNEKCSIPESENESQPQQNKAKGSLNMFQTFHKANTLQREENPEEKQEIDDLQMDNKKELFTPFSDNVLHHIGSSTYFQDFLQETPHSGKTKPFIFSSGFQQRTEEPTKRISINQKQISVKTFNECECAGMKKNKNQLISKVVEVVHEPLPSILNPKKGKLPHFLLHRPSKFCSPKKLYSGSNEAPSKFIFKPDMVPKYPRQFMKEPVSNRKNMKMVSPPQNQQIKWIPVPQQFNRMSTPWKK